MSIWCFSAVKSVFKPVLNNNNPSGGTAEFVAASGLPVAEALWCKSVLDVGRHRGKFTVELRAEEESTIVTRDRAHRTMPGTDVAIDLRVGCEIG